MRITKSRLYSGVTLACVLVSGLLFQNATTSSSDPCSGSSLCLAIVKQIKENQSKDPLLTNAVVIDLAANQFGYGVNSQMKDISTETASNLMVRQVARAIADGISAPREKNNVILRRIASTFGAETTHANKAAFNGITESTYSLAKKTADLRKTITDANRSETNSEISQIATNTRNSGAYYRSLMSLFGSQDLIDGAWTDNQVNAEDVLAEFWFNHFNVDVTKAGIYSGFGKGGYEPTIHENMYSTFADLLEAVQTHPAMLYYLDNQSNRFDLKTMSASNQNLGRELVELHTLGIGPGRYYQQKDIEESAKMLTGLNVAGARYDAKTGELLYGTKWLPKNHVSDYTGDLQTAPYFMKTRFCLSGQIGPNAKCAKDGTKGLSEKQLAVKMRAQQKAFFNFLAAHTRTKSNICNKLVAHFLAPAKVDSGKEDDPETLKDESKIEVQRSAVIAKCKEAWGTHGNLKAIYRSILTSPETWSRTNYLRRYKNPNELVISSLRQIGLDGRHFDDTSGSLIGKNLGTQAVSHMRYIGLPYRFWPTPTGYKQNGAYWISQGYLVRWIYSSFKLSSVVESRDADRNLPLMGQPTAKYPRGANEEMMDSITKGSDRLLYANKILGMSNVRIENLKTRRGIASVLEPANEDVQTKQRIDNKIQNVPLKTAVTLKLTNGTFIRR